MWKIIALATMLLPLVSGATSHSDLAWMEQLEHASESRAPLSETLKLLGRPYHTATVTTAGGAYAEPNQPRVCTPLPAGRILRVVTYRHPAQAHMESRFYFEGQQMRCHTWYFVDAARRPQNGP
ncbi:hypothetical protein PAGU2638_28580 [Lysobacter sp. PAGU 2638]